MDRDQIQSLKQAIAPLRRAMFDFEPGSVHAEFEALTVPDAQLRACHPFAVYASGGDYFDACLAPLQKAMPDLEARDEIVMAGASDKGCEWVGIMGNFVGTFAQPFLEIPPTGHLAYMRYHEYYRVEGGKVTELHALWDIPQLMMQADAWPASPSLGRELWVPGPGLRDDSNTDAGRSLKIVIDMLEQMLEYPGKGGPEKMQLERFWHPKMSWYGPAGIGAARGFGGFLHWHMIPWVTSMPDWSDLDIHVDAHFVAEGPFVGVTGWPSMRQTHVADGFLGLPPTGKRLDIRCLDFWRVEGDLIRENWVMVDMLDLYAQLGVDVLARMREFNKARTSGAALYP